MAREAFDAAGVRQTGLAPWNWVGEPGLVWAMALAGPPSGEGPPTLPGIHLDVSHWDYDTFDALCMAQGGVANVILGWQEPAKSREMARRAAAARVRIPMGYAFLYFGSSQPERATEAMVVGCRDAGIPYACLDLEADSSDWSLAGSTSADAVRQRNAQLERCARMVNDAGLRGYGYTAPWWGVPMHGNAPVLAQRGWPLWLANYGRNDGTLGPIRFTSVMGWDHCKIHQYTSTGGLCGRSVRDRNHVFADAFAGGEEDEMTDGERELLLKVATVLAGRPSGEDFQSVDDALGVLRPLAANDILTLLGLGNTQEALGQLRQRVDSMAAGTALAPGTKFTAEVV